MKLILDTCAIIWAVADEKRIPRVCADVLTAPETRIYISPISAAEIACACDRGRLVLDRHLKRWLHHFLDLNGWETLPIDLDIMEEAYSLPGKFHADPADRIIVATARRRELVVVTGDTKILSYPHVSILWDQKL